MNDERHDDKRPRGPSSHRRAGGDTRRTEPSRTEPSRTEPRRTEPGRDGREGPSKNARPSGRGPGSRPKYVAPPRVVYAPSKLVGIAGFETKTAPKDSARLVSMLLDIVEEASPLPAGRHKDIRRDVLELWRELTSEKSTRQPDYIGEPAKLAAYLRYFLPWNVVRLAPLLAGLELGLEPGDAVLDIGSGPLTVPIALWIARPDLRAMELRVDCVDRVRRVMDIGATILEGLALRAGQPFLWKVAVKKESFSLADDSERDRYALVTAANVFNESFWRVKGSLSERADMLASSLGANVAPGGGLLVVEPGDPRSGAMLAALRESVILRGGRPLAPCPHSAACPMAGSFLSGAFRKDDDDAPRPDGRTLERVVTARGRSKAPWCHFVMDPGAAPQRLVDFSETAGLPKDRLIASWLLLQPRPPAGSRESSPPDRSVRIVSDAFRLPDGGAGRYACTKTGYALARDSLADLPSGSLAVLDAPLPPSATERDPKSNAVLLRAHSAGIAPQELPYKPPRDHGKADRDADRGKPAGRSDRGDLGDRAPRSGDKKPGKSPERTRKPPIPKRGEARKEGGSSGRPPKGLAERSPYQRAKKPWGPHKPKRSS